MATGGSFTGQDVQCSLCLEPYGPRRIPKMLACFHTFCLPCLTKLEASVATATPRNARPEDSPEQSGEEDESGQPTDVDDNNPKEDTASKPGIKDKLGDVTDAGDGVTDAGDGVTDAGDGVTAGRDDAKKAAFLCPTCRVPVAVPEGGVAALQTNFYLSYDTAGCEALSSQRSGGKMFCPVHHDKELCFFCNPCDVTICLYCKVSSHEGHDTSDITRAVSQAKSEVVSLLTEAQQQLDVVETAVRRMDREERDIKRRAQGMKRKTTARHDAIITHVTQSRDDLMEEISEREELAKSQLRAEKTLASVSADTLSTVIVRAARASGSDVISVRKELQAALLSEDSLDKFKDRTAGQDTQPQWTYDVADDLAGPLASCMGGVVEVGADDVTKPPLSVAELANKLDRLENDIEDVKAEVMQSKGNARPKMLDWWKTAVMGNLKTAVMGNLKTAVMGNLKTAVMGNAETKVKKTAVIFLTVAAAVLLPILFARLAAK